MKPWRLALGVILVCAGAVEARAEDPFESCAHELREKAADWNACGCFYSVGNQQGLQDEAERRLGALAAQDPKAACPRFNLGRLRLLAGKSDALELLRSAAEIFKARGEAVGEVYARLNASRAAANAELPEEASSQLDAARRAATAAGDDLLQAQVLLQQGRLLLGQGQNLDDVESLLQAAAAKAAGQSASWLWRDLYQAHGNVRYLLGRFEEAEGFYMRMAEVCDEAGDLYCEATALLNQVIARTAPGQGTADREAVRALLHGALSAAMAAQQHHAEAEALLRLGKLPGEDVGSRREQLTRALDIAREIAAHDVEARALAALAVTWVDEDPQAAQSLVAASQQLARGSAHFGSSSYGWSDRLEAWWRTLDRDAATAASLELLDAVESLRASQRGDGERAEVFAVWTEIFYAVAGRLLNAAQAAEPSEQTRQLSLAFAVIERRRARVLLETLESFDSSEAVANAVSPVSFITLDEARAALKPNEAMLSFQMAPDEDVYGSFTGGSWLIVITAKASRFYRLPPKDRLEAGGRVFLSLVARRDGREVRAARRLGRDLLAGALADLPAGVDSLILVPDGILHRLPLAMLRDELDQPLIERFRLVTVPSATLWARWRSEELLLETHHDLAGVLAFGDPELPDAGQPDPELADSGLPEGRSPQQLAALPGARREARAALSHLGGTLLLGDQATEAALRTKTQDYQVLHFAAHAEVDSQRPERSAVRLAAGAGEDGLVSPAEIAELDLEGRLIVLSACQSAGGRVLAGEGPMSLARAFFAAGASGVVASLWPLRDDEAALLVEDFYTRLAAGDAMAEALAAAERASYQRGEPAAAWAGLVAFGDGDLEVHGKSTGSGRWRRPLILIAILVGLIGLIAVGVRAGAVARARGRR